MSVYCSGCGQPLALTNANGAVCCWTCSPLKRQLDEEKELERAAKLRRLTAKMDKQSKEASK